MERGKGLILLSFVLAWLSLAGLANAYLLLAPNGYRQLSSVAAAGFGLWVLAAVAMAYGVSAGTTAAGLLLLAPWTFRAFVVWGGSVVAAGVLFMIIPPFNSAAWYQHLAFLALAVAILVPIGAYVRRRTAFGTSVRPTGENLP